ncbi:hypothetical protein BSL78_18553 [Apostichopus japonicus]|uniref:Integrase catalytic domain-containing protein n=1 Tax=Stichopus japonicus TaxID=307972 RepID=A0A2G8K9E9_STIJA|nr:hypothetical protein BSL78_18553 [Apostichopus japonicus]
MKPVSIPRLELMGAVLAVTLYTSIKQEIRFDLDDVIFWTDSMIVLGYIRNEDKRFKTFVANRVSKIHDLSSPNQWRHVGSKENPADDGSRARRGQPVKIFSDNGSNFQAGEKELRNAFKAMNKDDVEAFFHSKGCEWHFNPPTASHFGGAWERLIRSVRRILRGVLRQQTVTDEVLTTVLAEVESILNSRPLTDFSSDPKDEEPLTPNHLFDETWA